MDEAVDSNEGKVSFVNMQRESISRILINFLYYFFGIIVGSVNNDLPAYFPNIIKTVKKINNTACIFCQNITE